VLEALASLLECLWDLTHPLGDLRHRPPALTVWAGGYIPGITRLEAGQRGCVRPRGAIGYDHASCNMRLSCFIPSFSQDGRAAGERDEQRVLAIRSGEVRAVTGEDVR